MSNLLDYQIKAIAAGYRFECPCGELLNSIAAAVRCKKCRTYAPLMRGQFVIDIAKDKVVFGSILSREEYNERVALHDIAIALSLGVFKPMPITSAP